MDYCKNGHPYDEVNTYIYPKTGRRMCRACHRDTERNRIAASPELTRKNRERTKAWALANPEQYSNYRVKRSTEIRTWVAAQRVSCKICGESAKACLDFHHRPGTKKEFNIGIANGTLSLKRIKLEVAKCDVICSNCHRKLHAAERSATR